MPLKKFGENDIFHNTIKTNPKNRFDIYNNKVYYQNQSEISGAFTSSVPNIPTGFKSLYELNVDRNEAETGLIYPFIAKNGTLSNFKTISTTSFNAQLFGEEISGSYPLSSSVTRQFITGISRPRINALRNSLNYYISSPHYQYSSSFGNKATQDINLISIPSIFFGSSLNKENGSISLKFYISGTLIGELKDERRNGELIQTGPPGSEGSGSIAGVVMYNEGFMLLTGSWPLETGVGRDYLENPSNFVTSSWLYYGTGMNDNSGSSIPSSSFSMEFEGVNYIETISMLAHANKGEYNHSNNPTYATFSSSSNFLVNETQFSENTREIKNIVESPYPSPTASFEKTTYISKIGIYDDQKNLIGIASVATPVRKTLNRDLTFKLKLDI